MGTQYLAKAYAGRRDGAPSLWDTKRAGAAALTSDVREERMASKRGLRELVDDPKAYDARLMDIAAASAVGCREPVRLRTLP